MRIIYLINDITMPGGLSRVTLNLINEFGGLQADLEVKAVSAAAKFSQVMHDKIDYLDMPPLHGLNPLQKVQWYWQLKCRVEAYIDAQDCDVVIAVGTAMTLFASFCRFKQAALWGAEHLAHNHYGVLRKAVKRWRYPKLHHLICLTQSDKERYYDKYLPSVAVIPNYTNFADVTVNAESRQAKNILFVGRYNQMKGVDYLLQVIQQVHPRCPDWHFNLFGEGEQKAWLTAELAKLGLSEVVTIHDPTSDISAEYRKAQFYILTSRNEGFPMVLLEAQAHGLPIVSFDCETGPAEIISHEQDGFLIPAFDVAAFADKVAQLASDEALRERMSQSALSNRRRFSKEAIIQLWLAEFHSRMN
ncbi:glycosyltransferase family 4 protein [Vibrio sp. CDRSL-10 TSBA]